MEKLENKIKNFLEKYEFSRLGVAVSGGADSICLLTSLCKILGSEKISCVTVNHNIREESETLGDVLFVKEYCEKLGVKCKIATIEKGKVFQIAKEKGGGIEDSARFLRYEIFQKFLEEENLDFLCLAHNDNDNLETVLMRFLQGAENLSGICENRGQFLRPLINCSRKEIEEYLIKKNVSWRTDSTNFENNYFRNRIRNVLVPVLNENFKGWSKAILNHLEKKEMSPSEKEMTEKIFDSFKNAGGKGRLPYSVVKEILKNGKATFENFTFNADLKKEGSDEIAEINCKKNDSLDKKKSTENEFYSIIYNGVASKTESFVEKNVCSCNAIENKGGNVAEENANEAYFLAVRNFKRDDKICDKNGVERSVLKILKNWKIPEEKRNSVCVVEKVFPESGKKIIVAVLGKAAGANEDFIVK